MWHLEARIGVKSRFFPTISHLPEAQNERVRIHRESRE